MEYSANNLIPNALPPARLKEMDTVVLAFVGDAVFTLYVREMLAKTSLGKSGVLSRRCSKVVNATAQARLLDRLLPDFSLEEAEISRRARNRHKKNTAKSANPGDYNKSTAFEAVVGYNYLAGNAARLNQILAEAGDPLLWGISPQKE